MLTTPRSGVGRAILARVAACASEVLLAQRARLDLAPPHENRRHASRAPGNSLGLTPREVEVLALVARGYTDREIAAALVISVKTASVHVSHILHKLGAPNRFEAAAIAHRVGPEPVAQPGPESAGRGPGRTAPLATAQGRLRSR